MTLITCDNLPFIFINSDGNHRTLLLYQYLLTNQFFEEIEAISKITYSINKINEKILFKKNKIILKNCTYNFSPLFSQLNDEFEDIKEIFINYPILVTILYNCVTNSMWQKNK